MTAPSVTPWSRKVTVPVADCEEVTCAVIVAGEVFGVFVLVVVKVTDVAVGVGMGVPPPPPPPELPPPQPMAIHTIRADADPSAIRRLRERRELIRRTRMARIAVAGKFHGTPRRRNMVGTSSGAALTVVLVEGGSVVSVKAVVAALLLLSVTVGDEKLHVAPAGTVPLAHDRVTGLAAALAGVTVIVAVPCWPAVTGITEGAAAKLKFGMFTLTKTNAPDEE